MKTGTLTAGIHSKSQRGFTYLMVLAALIVVGILAESAVQLNSRLVRAEQEQELLFRGLAYRNAIASYYYAKPARRYPRSLDVLVKDPRFLHKRHLRQRYTDPISKEEWSILKNDRGGITGVASRSQATPLKQANFPSELAHFAGAEQYREWIFEFQLPKKGQQKAK